MFRNGGLLIFFFFFRNGSPLIYFFLFYRNGGLLIYDGKLDNAMSLLKWLTDLENLKIDGRIEEVKKAEVKKNYVYYSKTYEPKQTIDKNHLTIHFIQGWDCDAGDVPGKGEGEKDQRKLTRKKARRKIECKLA